MIVKSAKEIISFQLNPLATRTLKRVQGDMFVILNLFQELIIRKGLLNIDKTDSSGFALRMTKNVCRHTEALAEVSIRWGKTQFTHSF